MAGVGGSIPGRYHDEGLRVPLDAGGVASCAGVWPCAYLPGAEEHSPVHRGN